MVILASACTLPPRVANPVLADETMRRDAARISARTMPFHVAAALSAYLEQLHPVYFLVANDLGHTQSFTCNESPCVYDGTSALLNARRSCENLRLGVNCTLLYLRREPLAQGLRFRDELGYRILPGERRVAPKKAHGKIIYLPGFSGWTFRGYNFPPNPADADLSPALEDLENRGWDVDVLYMHHLDRAFAWKKPELFVSLFSQLIDNAREAGFQRVILFGGSRGGAEIMQGTVGGASPRAIVLMEPDWHGPKFDSRGGFNDEHDERAAKITELVARLKVDRIVYAYFRDSRWYGDIGREEIEQALRETGASYVLIAAPPGLSGHGASWTRRFANMYGECLHTFLLGQLDAGHECEPEPVDESRYENWAVKKHVVEGGYRRLSITDIRDLYRENGLCPYTPDTGSVDEERCHIWVNDQRVTSFPNEFGNLIMTNDLIDFRESGFCRHNGFFNPTYRCLEMYQIDDKLIAVIPSDRDNIYWYQPVAREIVEQYHATARYICENRSKLSSGLCREL